MTNDEIKDLLKEVVSSAKQVNVMTGDHAQAIYNEAGAKGNTTKTEEAIKRAVIRLMEEKDACTLNLTKEESSKGEDPRPSQDS